MAKIRAILFGIPSRLMALSIPFLFLFVWGLVTLDYKFAIYFVGLYVIAFPMSWVLSCLAGETSFGDMLRAIFPGDS